VARQPKLVAQNFEYGIINQKAQIRFLNTWVSPKWRYILGHEKIRVTKLCSEI
jgi:hypothetical protein